MNPNLCTKTRERWTKELLEAISRKNKKTINAAKRKYNHPDVKKQLRRETHFKCAYCESRVTVVAHGDI